MCTVECSMPKPSAIYVALIAACSVIAAVISLFLAFRVWQNMQKRRQEGVRALAGDIMQGAGDRKRRFSMTEYDDLPALCTLKRQRGGAGDENAEQKWITCLRDLQKQEEATACSSMQQT